MQCATLTPEPAMPTLTNPSAKVFTNRRARAANLEDAYELAGRCATWIRARCK
jgi:hypothetical protein